MTAGLLQIESVSGTSLVDGNTFSSSGAIIDQSVLQIRQCEGLTLSDNTFTDNCGCQETGTVLVQCHSDDFTYSTEYNRYSLQDGQSPTTDSSVTLDSNIFQQNFVGKDKHVVSIEGFDTVTVTGDTFMLNENYLPQSFNSISPLATLFTQTEVTSLDYYDYKAQAILRVAASTEIQLSSLTFEENWIADHQSYQSDYQANALLVQDLTGVLYMDSVSFTGHVGVSSSDYADLTGDGFRSGLLVFKNVELEALTF